MILQDIDAILAFFTGIGIVIILAAIAIGFLLYTISLKIALGMVQGSDKEFGTVFITALLSYLVSYVPCVGCFLSIYFINSRHGISYGKGIIAYLLAGLLPAIAVTILFFVLGLSGDFMALLGL